MHIVHFAIGTSKGFVKVSDNGTMFVSFGCVFAAWHTFPQNVKYAASLAVEKAGL